MARIVESSSCPTCGKKTQEGIVQKYEIPEIPVVEVKVVDELRKQMDELNTAIKNIKIPEVKIPEVNLPEGLSDMCSKFPELCSRVDKLEEQSGKTLDLISSHPKPVKDALEKLWLDCPECADLWKKWKDEIGKAAATEAIIKYKEEQERVKLETKKKEEVESKEETKKPFPWMR